MYSFLLIAFIYLVTTPVQADVLRCADLLKASEAANLSDIVTEFSNRDLSVLRSQSTGQWVPLNDGHFVRYQMFGQKGPVRIHLEGLGGQLEGSMASKILKQHKRRGRILVIELEGQGLREVHQRVERIQQGLEPTRIVDYNENVKALQEALSLIQAKEGFSAKDIEVWSGHSFGGLTLSGLTLNLGELSKAPLLQFIASGVANFNHRFVSALGNIQINFLGMGQLFLPQSEAWLIQQTAEHFSTQPLFNHFKNDPVRLESAVALTLGAKNIDIVKDPTDYPSGTRVQIFSGQKDTVVFAMMHWELASAAREAQLPTTTVMVEKAGHYLPTDMTPAQTKTYDRITQNPSRYEGHYLLKANGRLLSLTAEAALQLYKQSSLEAWDVQRDFIEEVFSSLGQKASYPESWR